MTHEEVEEKRTINGYSYRRIQSESFKSIFWDLEDSYSLKYEEYDDIPDIVCDCGNSSFILKHGDYELFAVCSKCRLKESVYSG